MLVFYKKKYEEHINDKSINLSDNILAYRKVELDEKKDYAKKQRYKDHPRINNITMAREAFDEISRRIDDEQGCYVFAYDLEGFFNHLDHKKLYKAWVNILSVTKLKEDHLNIFRSLTKFSYINLKDFYKFFKNRLNVEKVYTKDKLYTDNNGKSKIAYKTRYGTFKESKKGIIYGEKHTLKALKNIFSNTFKGKGCFKKFKENFLKAGYKIHKNNNTFGIPQGTPISAVLANIYMLEFDKKMKELCDTYNLFYRRYSDDILIIAPLCECIKTIIKNKFESVNGTLSELQSTLGEKLNIHSIEGGKSQLITFDPSKKAKSKDKYEAVRISYLGFDFEYKYELSPHENKKMIHLRHSGVSKYFRKSIMWIRSSTRGLLKNKTFEQIDRSKLYKKKILSLYSCFNIHYKNAKHQHGNYLTYVYTKSVRRFKESKLYNSSTIKRSLKSHNKRLNGLINSAEELFHDYIKVKKKYPSLRKYPKISYTKFHRIQTKRYIHTKFNLKN